MKYNNDLFDFGKKKDLPAGQVHLKLNLPTMKITHHWRAGRCYVQACIDLMIP